MNISNCISVVHCLSVDGTFDDCQVHHVSHSTEDTMLTRYNRIL